MNREQHGQLRARGPERVAGFLLTVVVLGPIFLDHWWYSRESLENRTSWMSVVLGTAYAPNQYRIAVVDSAWFLARHAHLGAQNAFTLIDFIAASIAVFTLFFLLRQSAIYRNASIGQQWFGAAAFVFLVCFYLTWLQWYSHPETLTTTAILAVVLLLLTVKPPLPGRAGQALWAAALLVLAVTQGLVRADVVLAVHAGILIACLGPSGTGFSLRRPVQFATSFAAILISLGIQYYLMRIAFPQASYEAGKVVQLVNNLHPQVGWIAFAVFTTPFVWTLNALRQNRWRAESPQLAIVAAAVLFGGMWCTVGLIAEVRIFMPFAMALAPLTATLAMQQLFPVASTAFQPECAP